MSESKIYEGIQLLNDGKINFSGNYNDSILVCNYNQNVNNNDNTEEKERDKAEENNNKKSDENKEIEDNKKEKENNKDNDINNNKGDSYEKKNNNENNHTQNVKKEENNNNNNNNVITQKEETKAKTKKNIFDLSNGPLIEGSIASFAASSTCAGFIIIHTYSKRMKNSTKTKKKQKLLNQKKNLNFGDT